MRSRSHHGGRPDPQRPPSGRRTKRGQVVYGQIAENRLCCSGFGVSSIDLHVLVEGGRPWQASWRWPGWGSSSSGYGAVSGGVVDPTWRFARPMPLSSPAALSSSSSAWPSGPLPHSGQVPAAARSRDPRPFRQVPNQPRTSPPRCRPVRKRPVRCQPGRRPLRSGRSQGLWRRRPDLRTGPGGLRS